MSAIATSAMESSSARDHNLQHVQTQATPHTNRQADMIVIIPPTTSTAHKIPGSIVSLWSWRMRRCWVRLLSRAMV